MGIQSATAELGMIQTTKLRGAFTDKIKIAGIVYTAEFEGEICAGWTVERRAFYCRTTINIERTDMHPGRRHASPREHFCSEPMVNGNFGYFDRCEVVLIIDNGGTLRRVGGRNFECEGTILQAIILSSELYDCSELNSVDKWVL